MEHLAQGRRILNSSHFERAAASTLASLKDMVVPEDLQ
jgi:hypothetical protein